MLPVPLALYPSCSLSLHLHSRHTAYALSSNYNFPPGFGSGYDAIQAASTGIAAATEGAYTQLEEDLINALAVRSSAETKAAVNLAEMFLGMHYVAENLLPLDYEELEASLVGPNMHGGFMGSNFSNLETKGDRCGLYGPPLH